jgi:hypothetical protein
MRCTWVRFHAEAPRSFPPNFTWTPSPPASPTNPPTPPRPTPSPSLEEMETRMMEVLVFVDGIDAMTSKQMQVRVA